MKQLFKNLFSDRHEKEQRKLQPLVDEINRKFEEMREWPEEKVKGQTEAFKNRIAEHLAKTMTKLGAATDLRESSTTSEEREEHNQEVHKLQEKLRQQEQEILEELLPEAFATVKEAARRLVGHKFALMGQSAKWDMVHFDVQLIGGIVLHRGNIAEMATGEGKTLVATLPLYLNALLGRGAQLVTVNPYLAERDAQWMGVLYNYLGLTVDVIDLYAPGSEGRKKAYEADITYGTNSEFGFDYLRDHMATSKKNKVQKEHVYAIIDEIDSILIDEARTPLIISGPSDQGVDEYYQRYKGTVEQLAKAQNRMVANLVAEARKALEEDDTQTASIKLLAATRGAPKNKQLVKLLSERPMLQKRISEVELVFMKQSTMDEIDSQLLYVIDESGNTVQLSEEGIKRLSGEDPDAFVPPDLATEVNAIQESESLSDEEKETKIRQMEQEYGEKLRRMSTIHNLLKAYGLFEREEQYIVEDGRVHIVDEFTGRKMVGRRWSEGLHQAIEAKEDVDVSAESQTLATVTIQNYFRMYEKLAGMTGTAVTEEGEFQQLYGLDVTVIPTNVPIQREDREDLVYRTQREKYNALIGEIARLHRLEIPVLVGSASVATSETLSRLLKRARLPHQVLNAKHHKQESEIVRQAGLPSTITVATNMAGRGTDIKLSPEVKEARTWAWCKQKGLSLEEVQPTNPYERIEETTLGDETIVEIGGLHILGSERHESRRIDRQLRGRAGRQGDPGASQFLISLEDDLMRMFGSGKIVNVLDALGARDGEPLTHRMVTGAIGRAQQKVEQENFEARKNLLEFDDVNNQQREVVYDLRDFALESEQGLLVPLKEMIADAALGITEEHAEPGSHQSEWDVQGLKTHLLQEFFVNAEQLSVEAMPEGYDWEQLQDYVERVLVSVFETKVEEWGEHAPTVMRWALLSTLDHEWKEHLFDLDHLREGIGYRGYGQYKPIVEYKKEAFEMFKVLMGRLNKNVTGALLKARIAEVKRTGFREPSKVIATGPGDTPQSKPGSQPVRVTEEESVGRNDPCPCGSGKKYKRCCGMAA